MQTNKDAMATDYTMMALLSLRQMESFWRKVRNLHYRMWYISGLKEA
jgi:hypothetical protein